MAHETTYYPPLTRRILRLPQVEEMTGLRRSRIEDLRRVGRFPPPIRLSSRAIGWWEHELVAWLDARPRVESEGCAAPRGD